MAHGRAEAADEQQSHGAEQSDGDADLPHRIERRGMRGERMHQRMRAGIEAKHNPALRQKARDAHTSMPLPPDALPGRLKPLRQSDYPSFAQRADFPTSGKQAPAPG